MRITIHLPDSLAETVRTTASSENKSMSALIAETLNQHFQQKKRKRLGQKVLDLAAKSTVSPDAIKTLHKDRVNDRI